MAAGMLGRWRALGGLTTRAIAPVAACAAVLAAAAAPASAATTLPIVLPELPATPALPPPVPAIPIPNGFGAQSVPAVTGSPATPHPVRGVRRVPRNPYMAPNGRSNIHDDAYMTDSYRRRGPLGRHMTTTSTLFGHECASVAFDRRGRIVTVCVGVEQPQLHLLNPRTLASLAQFPLPPRVTTGGNLFTDFSGGGYFYLDNRDRAVIPTTTNHIWVVAEGGPAGFKLVRDYDLTKAVPLGDKVESALPDWHGRIWFVSAKGVVGDVDPRSGRVRWLDTHEAIGNSFATDETGGVYVVTDAAMYRFDARRNGAPKITWRARYRNDGKAKPGQTEVGSGTTPTVTGPYVAITDNSDPIDVVVYRRAKRARHRRVCVQPVFRKGASDTDQSLVAAGRALIAENNYGYAGPLSVENGASTTGGLERVDIRRHGRGCRSVWVSHERAPSVVPKVSLGAGLVYTYTKEPRSDGIDAWYFTALDFRTGHRVYKRLAGLGLGYNNNYSPVTIGPDGSAYVGTLGGLVELRDGR